MNCPLDGTELVMTDRSGVEIDYCPKCRGVWLDRGELDKIIERGAVTVAPTPGISQDRDRRLDDDDYRQGDYRDMGRHGGSKPYRRKRKESFLSELFDF